MWRKCWGVMHADNSVQANRCPERLGFPVSIIGTCEDTERSVLRFMRGDLKPNEQNI